MRLPVLAAVAAVTMLSGCSALRPKKVEKESAVKVARGDVVVEVVESGTVDADRVVEVKSRVAGRVKKLLVDEGDVLEPGQLIAEIDPQETKLQLEQNRAQLRGAIANVSRTDIEIQQRRVSAQAALDQARIRLAQLEQESVAQPKLTQSGIASSQAAYDQAVQQRRQLVQATQPNERTALQAELDQAKVSLENANLELERLRTLVQKEFVPQRDVDNQQLQVDLAKSRYLSVQERMRRLTTQQEAELKAADERIRQAEAELRRAKASSYLDSNKRQDVANARAAVRSAEAALKDVNALMAQKLQSQASVDQLRSVLSDSERQLSETSIKAPIGGIVTKRLIQEGELVSSLSSFSSGTPIVRLEDRSRMVVKLNINEIDTAKLKLGMAAKVQVDAIPNKAFAGQVVKIAPAKNAETAADGVVRFQVEVALNELDSSIKSGMTAKVTVQTVNLKNVLSVPADYVVTEGINRYVLIPDKDPKKEPMKVKVTVGAESTARVQILSGVSEGTELARPTFSGPKRRGMGPEAQN